MSSMGRTIHYVLRSTTTLQRYAFFLMQTYLTKTWGLSFTHAAGIVNIWNGARKILPLLCRHLADAYLGYFGMLLISVISDCLGMSLIAMSTPPALARHTNMCKQYRPECIGEAHKILFYLGLALVAVGLAGYKATAKCFVKDQGYTSSQVSTLWMPVFLSFPLRILAIALPSIGNWAACFGVIAIFTAVAMLVFICGSCDYDKEKPKGSLISTLCGEVVACVRSLLLQCYQRKPRQEHDSTSSTAPANAAIELGRVSRVEEINTSNDAKLVGGRLYVSFLFIAFWGSYIVCGIVSSIGDTYFVEQANNMNRKLYNWNVPLPLVLLYTEFLRFDVQSAVEEKLKKKGYVLIGIVMSKLPTVLCCITAAKIEAQRLSVVRSNDLLDRPDEVVPMSVFWLLFQFSLLGLVDSQSTVQSKMNKALASEDESRADYLDLLTEAVFGIGSIISVLSVHVVGQASGRGGNPSWFQFSLNRSRLDKYYWVLAVLGSANLVVYFVLFCCSGIWCSFIGSSFDDVDDNEDDDTRMM